MKKLFLEVHYHVKPGKRDVFYNEICALGIPEASRAEDGNRKYDYLFNPTDENDLVLLELWDTAEAQKIHGTTPHYAKLSVLKEKYVENTELIRYLAESVE